MGNISPANEADQLNIHMEKHEGYTNAKQKMNLTGKATEMPELKTWWFLKHLDHFDRMVTGNIS